ncbi:OmpW family protein [Lysobacter dokdonensis DS-58]|uniref:OmpW family protein n=1 Tax=Lysobacter dokdonensis DS-58 TaxID=1300345 RepID=A0A0A2WQX8_9GAMM|nr:OmpW family outer membrane protein [Lysobacter dokdonensis]KGQ20670.1 OmpW family protein [Lysobacter dokdonensis DS-58]
MDGGANPIGHIPVAMQANASFDNESGDEVFSVSAALHLSASFAVEVWAAQGAEQALDIDAPGHDIQVAKYSTAPIALMAQYRFGGMGRVTPFIGAGWHWNNVSDITTNRAHEEVAGLKLSNGSGPAAVAGIDIALSKGWFARGDFRWMDVSTDVSTREMAKKTVDTDKTYFGVALGFQF